MRKETNLPKHTQKEVFKVPDGYFENFESRLFTSLENSPTEIAPKYRRLRYSRWVSIAATVTILLGIAVFYTSKDQYANLNNETIESYLQGQSVFVSTNMESYLEEQDVVELEKTISWDAVELDEYLLTSTDIEYYINE